MSFNKKILIVEDDNYIREDLIKALTLSGFDAVEANNGAVGFQQALNHLPDLIISDVMMPEVNGIELLSMIRENPATDGIPFLFLSAKSDIISIREGMNIGADDYIAKPFDFDELIQAVNIRLERKEQQLRKWKEDMENLRGNLTNTLPHELRTPLSIILGYSEFVKDRYDDLNKEEILDMLSNIHTAGKRLHRLVENYLQLAQIEILTNSPSEVSALKTFSTFSPDHLLHSIVNEKALISNRLSDLATNLVDADVLIFEAHFIKIFEEIFDNAIKYSSIGEKIGVDSYCEDGYYKVKVTDSGRGMTEEQISKIGAYMQFDRNLYEQQGIGLGLVIAKKLTEINSGIFKISRNEPKGCVVELAFKLIESK